MSRKKLFGVYLIFRIKASKYPLKKFEIHCYNTRAKDLFRNKSHTLPKYDHSPVYAGKSLDNKIPQFIKSLNYDKFKIGINNLLVKSAIILWQSFYLKV